MDFNFLGGVNSIYALVGVVLMLFFQMWIKAREDKRYRDERKESELKKAKDEKDMHKESLAATNKMIEAQIEQTKIITESLNRNNEITDLHTENIIDIAETIDKKHKTKKARVYKEKYKAVEDKHSKKIKIV